MTSVKIKKGERTLLKLPASTEKKCVKNKEKWFDYFSDIAKSKGGKVLSEKYERMHSKMTFECKKGHVFSAKCHDVRQKGTWCPECAGNKRLTIEKLREVAASHAGVLLTQAYMGLDIDHMWACSKGHQFTHTPLNVLYNKAWCPICSKELKKNKRREKHLNDLVKIAEKNGGKILSPTYVNSRSVILCECADGHQFKSTAEKLNRGDWCVHEDHVARINKDKI